MKNDFVNNMTHEFKTPISTISVASEMLMKPAVSEFPDKIQKYANIIYDENLRLRNQVEQVLQISILDKNELIIQPVDIDIHPIIENSVDIFNMIVREKEGEIVSELNATQSVIYADELHFINVITNMLDNAIKYTDTKPRIKISTFNKDNGITIRVEDNGIGIDSASQKHIYKKFFRVHTGDVHNVKGFGLGLFYVKSVMDMHQGTIELVKSELTRGSIFELHFPFNFNKNQNI
jgi:two-component system, OmpR family, phosphate regulon sensor histidine kinase PhoR